MTQTSDEEGSGVSVQEAPGTYDILRVRRADDTPILQLAGPDGNHDISFFGNPEESAAPIIRITGDGEFYVRGSLVTEDKELHRAFVTFFQGISLYPKDAVMADDQDGAPDDA